jgi:hypothetical protein
MIEEVLPPYSSVNTDRIKVFLAGTIDMGNSLDWQKKFVDDNQDLDITIFNPRRKDWDSSWVQDKNNPKFKEQVSWELSSLENCDIAIFHFEPNSVSMISLMELGKFSGPDRHVFVHCPDGYMRKGNVDIFCERYNITMFDSVEEMYPVVKYIAQQKIRKK